MKFITENSMRCLSDDNYYYAEYYNIVKNEDDDPITNDYRCF